MSNPYIGKEPLRSVYNVLTGDEGKPEELYISDYWPEYNTPKILLDTELRGNDETDWISQYRMPSLENKIFMIQDDSYSPKSRKHTFKLKEL